MVARGRLAAGVVSCSASPPAPRAGHYGRRIGLLLVGALIACHQAWAAGGGSPPVLAANRSKLSPAIGGLRAPVAAACVSSPFGPRILPHRPLAGTYHYGIDLPARIGARVTAVAPGVLIRVQDKGVGGLEMLVQHPGFIGIYSHLGLIAPTLLEGRRVIRAGEWLATVGRSGLTYGPHLYFGMVVDGHAVDPAPYLHVRPCGGGGTERAVVAHRRPYGTVRRYASHRAP